MRTVGFIVAGTGIAALGTGAVMALIAMNDNSKSNDTCDAANVCDPKGFTKRNDARSEGNIATGFFIGGGVALAAGAALVLFAPRTRTAAMIQPLVSTQGAGFALRGAF